MAKNHDDLKQKCYKICSDFLEGPWRSISFEDMKFSEIQGGLMNKLFHCALPASVLNKSNTREEYDIPTEALVRFYGPQQENKEVLSREIVIFTTLSERNIGPKLYGVFANGRLEQYLPSKPISVWYDFSDLYVDVAKELAKFHSLQVPVIKSPALEDHVQEWIDDFKKIPKPNLTGHSLCEIMSTGEFEREFIWLMEEVKKLKAKIVFCHNDLQGGNILLLNDPLKNLKKRITFVDYEFSAYNYRGYDIADYFIEKCFDYRPTTLNSFKCNFDNFPTKHEQEKFVDAYLKQFQKYDKELEDDFRKQEEKNKILEEVSLLKLGPCLYWTLLNLKTGLSPHSDFPFMEISNKTWEFYRKLKKEYLRENKLRALDKEK